ncbi:MAG TPA: response regulator transcription factor [Aquabacterium sp.]|nr:response regulator transcription factor [Aquabacterium sp.]
MTSIEVILTDDHSIVRSGLRQLLTSAGDIRVVGEAADGHALLDLLRQSVPDVVLLDLSMPGLSGGELIKRVHQTYPELPVLVLSMHVEAQIVARVLRAGAAGYATKDCDPAALIGAVRKVAAKGRYIDPALVDSVVFQGGLSAATDNPHDQLSPRELQVLERIAAGQALGQIADALHLSPKTVSTHKMRLMQKLNLQTNADLLKYAVRHGITSS